MNIENYNYWNDSRTIAGMVPKPKIQETKNGVSILFETEGEDGVITVHWLRTKWEVCGTCDGNGKHVNANIDASGLTAEDFDRDPDLLEDYTSGLYDIQCNECKGRRVVPVVDESNNDKALVAKYQQHLQDEYRDAGIQAAERAMGA